MKILNCPLCDSEAELIDNRLCWSVHCMNEKECGCCVIGERVPEPASEEACSDINWNSLLNTAITRWNKRASIG